MSSAACHSEPPFVLGKVMSFCDQQPTGAVLVHACNIVTKLQRHLRCSSVYILVISSLNCTVIDSCEVLCLCLCFQFQHPSPAPIFHVLLVYSYIP